jgi:glycosyltransferase involved in cell wall biosynthesis
MLRYEADLGRGYFVEFFRRNSKFQKRTIQSSLHTDHFKSVSICTTCMNRLRDLKQTLPKNIEDSLTYPLVEFVLLDYGSTDGVGEWVREEMSDHLQSGRLIYYRADNQPFFRPNHSRNISFRLARGDLVANVDTDNFIHRGYIEAINLCACKSENIIILPQSFLKPKSSRLFLRGRFAINRQDIYQLGGFDEDLDAGYSHDDVSFVLRAMLSGFEVVRFDDRFLSNRIETPLQERIKHMNVDDFNRGKDTNIKIVQEKVSRCELRANKHHRWGNAVVVKNFSEVLEV